MVGGCFFSNLPARGGGRSGHDSTFMRLLDLTSLPPKEKKKNQEPLCSAFCHRWPDPWSCPPPFGKGPKGSSPRWAGGDPPRVIVGVRGKQQAKKTRSLMNRRFASAYSGKSRSFPWAPPQSCFNWAVYSLQSSWARFVARPKDAKLLIFLIIWDGVPNKESGLFQALVPRRERK